jgi:hypothetical protein
LKTRKTIEKNNLGSKGLYSSEGGRILALGKKDGVELGRQDEKERKKEREHYNSLIH